MKNCEQCGRGVARRTRDTGGLLVCQDCLEGKTKPKEKSKTKKETKLGKSFKRRNAKTQHVIVEAYAGTGKTTTLVEGLKAMRGLPTKIKPSTQQQAVWDALRQSPKDSRACFVAFNKAIATELQERVPEGCDAMTIHSMGYRAIREAFGKVQISSWRVSDIIAEIMEMDIREIRRKKFEVLKATEKLVGLCKLNLALMDEGENTEEAITNLAAYYDIDLNGNASEVLTLVPRVLERCKEAARDGKIDFNDMVWLPVILNLPLQQYDLLLVDEAQDLNRCQQSLVKRAGRRLIFCGDPCQAIYGFAGADCDSMDKLRHELDATPQGCLHLRLTVTRRCGKAIVKEAQKIVPGFEAHESNSKGNVNQASLPNEETGKGYSTLVADGDMILCRVNAPLVSECFNFIKEGKKANIRGRDVGQGLISTIKKSKSTTVVQLVSWLGDWLDREQKKEQAKRNSSEGRSIALQDRHDCILAFTEGATQTAEVVAKIEAVFTDDKNGGILLSSVHKAKGLEAKRVFILMPPNSGMPHPMAKSSWQIKQEWNLKYVALTRAIEELVWVS